MSNSFEKYQTELNDICKEIQRQSKVLDNAQDRILVVLWLKKIRSSNECLVLNTQQLIEYAKYLLVTIEADKSIKRFPFNKFPPNENNNIGFESLLESLGNNFIQQKLLQKQCGGAFYPIISHKSNDKNAIVAAKRCNLNSDENGTLLCYLSISHDKVK